MVYKKHSWIKYGSNSTRNIIEVIMRDGSGRKIDSFKCNDEKGWKSILRIVRDSYGYNFAQDTFERNKEHLEEMEFLKKEIASNQ